MTSLDWKKIAQKLKNSITTNPILKIFAVLLAVLIWIVVVNVSDPDFVVEFRDIRIQILNENFFAEQDKTYTISGSDSTTVSVTVRGPRSLLEQLSSSDFVAIANLNRYDASTNSVPVDISLSSAYAKHQDDIEFLSRPFSLWVSLEDVTEVDYNIQINYSGENRMADSYIKGDAILSSPQITVRAPLSIHEKIERAVIQVDLEDAKEDISLSGITPSLYEKSGRLVEITGDVSVLPKVDVTVPVYYKKEVSIEVAAPGTCAEGYEVNSVISNISTVEIYGKKDILDLINNIVINGGEISLDGLTESKIFMVSLASYLPEGVYVYGEENETVQITVDIEPWLSRTITIEKADIMYTGGPKDYLVDFADDNPVRIVLTGLKEDLDNLDLDALNPYVELGDIREGSSAVLLHISLPNNVMQNEPVYVVMTVRKVEEAGGNVTTPPEETTNPSQESTSGQNEPQTSEPQGAEIPESSSGPQSEPHSENNTESDGSGGQNPE